MYDEIKFLFDPTIKIDNKDNTRSIFPDSTGKNLIVSFRDKSASSTAGIKNFIKSNSYQDQPYGDSNPFVKLLNDPSFNSSPLLLTPQDFVYLTDLGVYPINRLVILRRYAEDVIVPHNLNDLPQDVRPISTIIGWVNKKDEEMLSFSFNENWVTETKLIHEMVSDFLKNETKSNYGGGIDLSKVVSIPSWSQGLLFGFLNAMGLTDYKLEELPIGDPNVLKESSRRDIEQQGLESSINITLKTSYEQKYINNVDPGSAMLDILNRLMTVGTSDQRFYLSGNGARKVYDAIMNKNNYLSVWENAIDDLVKKFVDTTNQMIDNLKKEAEDKGVTKATTDVAKKLLTGIIRKYRWPMRGSLGFMTGLSTTPWHITIGNPYNPVISMSNILVSDVQVGLSNDFGFNDMPMKINVDITIKQSRPFGKGELMEVFNNGYGRDYAPAETNGSYAERTVDPVTNTYTGNVNKKDESYFDPGLKGLPADYQYYREDSETYGTRSVAP